MGMPVKKDHEETAFAQWTRKPAAGATLRIPSTNLVAPPSLTRLSPEPAKRRDEVAALFGRAPKDVRDAAVAAAETNSDDYSNLVATVRISTERIDSYNSTINVDGWETSDYRNNPVVLFAHNSYALPVARDLGTYKDTERRALMGVSQFVGPKLGAEEAKVGAWVGAKLLNATSVGFEPLEWEIAEDRDDGSSWFYPMDFIRQALREYSWVPVPANPDCLVDARSIRDLGLDPREFRRMIEESLEASETFYIPRRQLLELHRADPGTAVVVDMGALGKYRVTPGVQPEERVAGDDEERADLTCPSCGYTGPASDFQGGSGTGSGSDEAEAEDVVDKSNRPITRVDDRAHPRHAEPQEGRDAKLAGMVGPLIDMIDAGKLP